MPLGQLQSNCGPHVFMVKNKNTTPSCEPHLILFCVGKFQTRECQTLTYLQGQSGGASSRYIAWCCLKISPVAQAQTRVTLVSLYSLMHCVYVTAVLYPPSWRSWEADSCPLGFQELSLLGGVWIWTSRWMDGACCRHTVQLTLLPLLVER